mmetsp:Transcript_45296/g.106917  ORF Transcript_45296/g.106917 Transcript_45296/m.106917 type:complete len:210 (+) Transcript_45296:176-805(+)
MYWVMMGYPYWHRLYFRLSWKERCTAHPRSAPPVSALFLSANQCGDSGAAALASLIQGSSSLERIGYNDNAISDAAATTLAASLTKTTCLEVIGFANCRLSSVGASVLAKALSSNTSLVRFFINRNPAVASAAGEYADAIERHPRLLRLGLSEVGADEPSTRRLLTALENRHMAAMQRKNPDLERLCFYGNPFTPLLQHLDNVNTDPHG